MHEMARIESKVDHTIKQLNFVIRQNWHEIDLLEQLLEIGDDPRLVSVLADVKAKTAALKAAIEAAPPPTE